MLELDNASNGFILNLATSLLISISNQRMILSLISRNYSYKIHQESSL